MRNLSILDWSWYIFRAYYALPQLTNKEGENINAIYWFFKMLLSLLKEKPDYFVIAWDSPAPTIRKQIFTQYKANRPSLPDNFKRQIKNIKELVKKANIPYLEIPWYEADDIIYSIIENFKDKNLSFNIISADKDLRQFLWRWNITIVDPQRLKKYDQIEFFKKYGFQPQYIVDRLALVWDSSDNIPWVKWIWEKTATQLIQKYNTIENIYNNLEKLPTKIRNLLEKWKEDAFKSKKLIQLILVPWIENINIEEFTAKKINFDKLEENLIKKRWFKSLQKNIEEIKKLYSKSQLSLF